MCSTSTSPTSSPVSVVHRHYDKIDTIRPLHLSTPDLGQSSRVKHVCLGAVAGVASLAFSLCFPFMLAPWAASQTYHAAYYTYDAEISHFDNTILTYGTDYLLAFTMGVLALSISTSHFASRKLAWLSRGMLVMYMLSVLTGAIAHHFYTSLHERNTWHFRAIWTVCVGTVTAATGFQGAIGTELVKIDRRQGLSGLPLIPTACWLGYSIICTAIVVAGGVSFQRPACDIFIAGITQSPCSFYILANLAVGIPMCPVRKWTRAVGAMSFIMNAPLLPIYPLLVHYTDWSLGAINFLLHTWLFLSWSIQGCTLRLVARRLEQASVAPPGAVPLKRKAI